MANCKTNCKTLAKGLLQGLLIYLTLPFIGGLYYWRCVDVQAEQHWLNAATAHLRTLRDRCDDPELYAVLDYTIQRYHRVGAWDVMVMPCASTDAISVLGVNCPWCPGITLDPATLRMSLHDGALVLVHEALHDYYPYFGHAHVDPVMKRIEKLEQL